MAQWPYLQQVFSAPQLQNYFHTRESRSLTNVDADGAVNALRGSVPPKLLGILEDSNKLARGLGEDITETPEQKNAINFLSSEPTGSILG